MRFFIDANLSEQLARRLREFGEDVVHLKEHFSQDEADEVWLRHIGEEGWFLVTRDDRIRWQPAQKEALRRHMVGAFFLAGKNLTRWQLVVQVIRNWNRIKELAGSKQPPFAYRVPPHGTSIKSLQL